MFDYYVYVYLNQGQPYYVGKGKGNRYKQPHLYVDVPAQEDIVIMGNMTEENAWRTEEVIIDILGLKAEGGMLDNLQRGGKTQKSGWHHADIVKQRISETLKGIPKTEETKQKMRKPNTTAHNEKIKQANIGRARDGRYEKTGMKMSQKRWYNDGVVTKMFVPGTEPEGFQKGRKL